MLNTHNTDYSFYTTEQLISELTRCKKILNKFQEESESRFCVYCDQIEVNGDDIGRCMSCNQLCCDDGMGNVPKCGTLVCKNAYINECEMDGPPARLCKVCVKDKSIKQTYMKRNICYKCKGL